MNTNDLFKDISKVAGYLWERGWADCNAGNISVNITEKVDLKKISERGVVISIRKKYESLRNNFIWMTGAGTRMRNIAKDIVNNSLIVNILDDGMSYRKYNIGDVFENTKNCVREIKPTSEVPTHFAIHNLLMEKGMKEKLILHTHPTELIALTHIKEFKNSESVTDILRKMQPEMKNILPEGIGFVQYKPAGSEEIAELTVKEFEKHKLVLWERHGCTAIGKDVMEAFDIIDAIAKALKIFFMSKG